MYCIINKKSANFERLLLFRDYKGSMLSDIDFSLEFFYRGLLYLTCVLYIITSSYLADGGRSVGLENVIFSVVQKGDIHCERQSHVKVRQKENLLTDGNKAR